MAKARAEDAKDVLTQNRQAALSYADHAGPGRVRELMAFAEADLLERIAAVHGAGTFTEVNLQSMLRQVRLVTSQLTTQLTGTIVDESDQMSTMAAQGTIDYMTEADNQFRGTGVRPLALDEASMFDVAKTGARASVLRRLAMSGEVGGVDPNADPAKMGIMQRYGLNTVGEFEKVLRVGLVTRKGIDEVKGSLTKASPFLQGKPGFWAERIARTEMMGAYNRAGWESQREVNEQIGGDEMVRILCATFDDRTAADSYAVHGQIRRTEEAFETWYGMMQHPPARPNDREIVVPHRIQWDIPDYLKPMSPGSIAERWHYEGRKGHPPPRPLMTTVPLERFGKEVEKDEDEDKKRDDQPTDAQQDAIDKGQLAGQLGDDMFQQRGADPNAPAPEDAAPPPTVDEQTASLIDGMSPGTRPGNLMHGMPHTKNGSMPWDTWSEAEQNLLSDIADSLAENDKKEEIAPDEVIQKHPEINKIGMKYGIEDTLNNMSITPVVVKKNGVLYTYTGSGTLIANAMLGNEALNAHVVDLDDSQVAARFEAVKPKAPAAVTGDVIMGTKTSGKAGSNEGGFYKGTDGVERYVKAYTDPDQAHCEAIANSIYQKLGLAAPDSQVFEHEGKTLYAHPTVPGVTLDKVTLTKPLAKKILDGFAADILLGNRDVIGLSKDNILITPGGGVRRIDNGGSLLMRANAGKKNHADLFTLREWDGFFNPDVNTYAGVLKAAGVTSHKEMKTQLVKGISDIKKLRDSLGGWEKFLAESAPKMDPAARKTVADMLEARTDLLDAQLKILRKREPKPKPRAPGAWGPTEAVTFEDLKKQIIPEHLGPKNTPTETPNGKSVGASHIRGTYRGDAHQTLQSQTKVAERDAITKFTGGSYGEIRNAGRMTEEQYKAAGGYDYERYKRDANNVESAFDKIPEDQRVPGVVFRGIQVPRVVANAMLAQNDKPHMPGLGSMFSTSRRLEPAKSFMGSGQGDTHVMMVIDQKRGVAIETISQHETEHEVLMSGKTKCRLVSSMVVERIGSYMNVLVLHYEEVIE